MPNLFRNKKVTNILEKLFRKVLTLPDQPAHTDDVALFMDNCKSNPAELAVICEDDKPDLWNRLEADLIELEMDMSETHDTGWLIELLGEGKIDEKEEALVRKTTAEN